MARSKAMSVDEGRELVARWEQSGLSQSAFAEREQMDRSKISYWIRNVGRLGGRDKEAVARGFVRVRARQEESGPEGTIEVVMGGGLCVRVRGEVDDRLLRRVLAAAAELGC